MNSPMVVSHGHRLSTSRKIRRGSTAAVDLGQRLRAGAAAAAVEHAQFAEIIVLTGVGERVVVVAARVLEDLHPAGSTR